MAINEKSSTIGSISRVKREKHLSKLESLFQIADMEEMIRLREEAPKLKTIEEMEENIKKREDLIVIDDYWGPIFQMLAEIYTERLKSQE